MPSTLMRPGPGREYRITFCGFSAYPQTFTLENQASGPPAAKPA